MLGAFNLIPYFGAITATVLTGVITVFTGSLTLAIVAVVSMIILQQLDSNLIQPKLFVRFTADKTVLGNIRYPFGRRAVRCSWNFPGGTYHCSLQKYID